MKFSLFGVPPDPPSASRKSSTPPEEPIRAPIENDTQASILAEPGGHYGFSDAQLPKSRMKAQPDTGLVKDIQKNDLPWETSAKIQSERMDGSGKKVGELHPIGQFMYLYILCETSDDGAGRSLVVIDQHAAHERSCLET